jgi:AbrB family looped-hinge helix DNA binding protein
MTVTVKRIGGSVAVVIPKAVARDMELAEGTELDLSTTADAIVMRKQTRRRRARRSIASIVSQIKPASYQRRSRELAERGPVGAEVW